MIRESELPPDSTPGGYYWKFLVGVCQRVCRPVLQILTDI